MAGELKEGMTICDPACGVGKFPLEFIKHDINKLYSVENGELKSKVNIVGFDKGFTNEEQKGHIKPTTCKANKSEATNSLVDVEEVEKNLNTPLKYFFSNYLSFQGDVLPIFLCIFRKKNMSPKAIQ